jgi:hypothetical protein
MTGTSGARSGGAPFAVANRAPPLFRVQRLKTSNVTDSRFLLGSPIVHFPPAPESPFCGSWLGVAHTEIS